MNDIKERMKASLSKSTSIECDERWHISQSP